MLKIDTFEVKFDPEKYIFLIFNLYKFVNQILTKKMVWSDIINYRIYKIKAIKKTSKYIAILFRRT